jgi:hypothetical protein
MNIHHKALGLADALNAQCSCMSFDRNRLIKTLQAHVDVGTMWSDLAVTDPHLFAATPAFISSEILAEMQKVVQTIEKLAKSVAFRQTALADARLSRSVILDPLAYSWAMIFMSRQRDRSLSKSTPMPESHF